MEAPNSECIAKQVYEAVLTYLERQLGPELVTHHLHHTFPQWSDAWHTIRQWLQGHALTSMHTSIHSFAQLFPDYESFAPDLDNCLAVSEDFWNQVYLNLRIAKNYL